MIPLFRNKKAPCFGHISLNPTAYWLYYAHNNTENRQYFELRREELSTWDEGFYDLCAELIGRLLANHHCYTYDSPIIQYKETWWSAFISCKPVCSIFKPTTVLENQPSLVYSLGMDAVHYQQTREAFSKENQQPLIEIYAFATPCSTMPISQSELEQYTSSHINEVPEWNGDDHSTLALHLRSLRHTQNRSGLSRPYIRWIWRCQILWQHCARLCFARWCTVPAARHALPCFLSWPHAHRDG